MLYGRFDTMCLGVSGQSAILYLRASPLTIFKQLPVFSLISSMTAIQRSSISITVSCRGQADRIERVRPPGPGPISQTNPLPKSRNPCRSRDVRMILSVMFESSRKFCPKAFFAIRPCASTVRRRLGSFWICSEKSFILAPEFN